VFILRSLTGYPYHRNYFFNHKSFLKMFFSALDIPFVFSLFLTVFGSPASVFVVCRYGIRDVERWAKNLKLTTQSFVIYFPPSVYISLGRRILNVDR
jgi:hypothetical protein